ncbi:MAG: AAA family ATPase [Paracoccaceae bacterium]
MRLDRLTLERYGHFEGAVLDFGTPHADGPDVTVIFGPNEAGKSTAYAAWLDFLFGYARRNHPYAFQFERRDLSVGARLTVPGGARLDLRRTAAAADSLRDAEDRPVPERLLDLHGLDRDGYRTRFSLDGAVLQAGGAEIARAQGELGRLLHAGSSGLSGLSEGIEVLRAEVDAFHKPRARSTALQEAKRALQETQDALRASQLTRREDAELSAKAAEAEAAIAPARAALDGARRALAAARAVRARQAEDARLAEIDAALAALPDGSRLPDGAEARIAAAQERIAAAGVAMRRAEADRAKADAALEALPEEVGGDDRIAARLEALKAETFDGAPLIERATASAADLTGREADLREARRRLTEAAAGVGSGVPEAVTPDAPTLERIETAARTWSEARADARAARGDAARLRAGLGGAPDAPEPSDALDAALRRFEATGDGTDEEDVLALAEAALAQAVLGLPKDWADRPAAELPEAETIAVAQRDWDRADEAAARAAEAAAAASDALAAARARLEAATPEAVDAGDLTASRAARDAAWHAHLAALDRDSADRFEALMRADDGLTARHAEGAEARVRVAEARAALAEAETRAERAASAAVSADAARDMARDGLDDLATALALPDGTPAEALRPRLDALAAAWRTKGAVTTARAALARARERRDEAGRALAGCLPEADAGDLAAAARSELERRAQAREARAVWETRRDQVLAREAECDALDDALSLASDALRDAASGLTLSDRAPAAIAASLPALRELPGLMRDANDLDRRVAAMEAARDRLEAGIADLRALGVEGRDAPAVLEAARARGAEALRLREARERATEARDDAARRIAEAEGQGEEAHAILDAALDGQGGAVLAPAVRLDALRRRDALRRDRDGVAEARARAVRGIEAADLREAEARATEPDHVAALEAARDVAETELETAQKAHGAAAEALRLARARDGGVLADQARAALLEDLRHRARDVARLRIGLIAAQAGLDRMAETGRGPMLRETEAAFRRMTGGDWERLDVWSRDAGQVLVGVRDGTATGAEAMSTGTRGQLYLALRLAGHRAFCEAHGPLPFVLDDILETFDDARAAAALDLCATLGGRGQAILFTHHAHLRDMAAERIPAARVVDMPTRRTVAA